MIYFGTGTCYNPDRAEVGMSKMIFEYRKLVIAAWGKIIKKEVDVQQNQSVNGCDRLDQLVSYCNIVDRKTIKCWNRVFSWVIEFTKINAESAEGHK